MSSGNPIFAVLWAVLLFFIAWPVAGICAGLWLLLVRDRSASKFGGRIESRIKDQCINLCRQPKQHALHACELGVAKSTKKRPTLRQVAFSWQDLRPLSLQSHCIFSPFAFHFRRVLIPRSRHHPPQQPFEAFLPFLKQVTEFLEKLLTWPRSK